MAFDRLTNLFPIRKSAVMSGLIGNLAANYLRLGLQLRFLRYPPYTRRFRSGFPQKAGTAGDLSFGRLHAQLAVKTSGASALRNKLTIRFKLNPDSAAISGRFSWVYSQA